MNRPDDFRYTTPVDFAALREERDRVCTHPLFKRSPLMARLLYYLVEHCADNGGMAPKSYAIAVDVLGRGVDFDPATDSYPRVMVGRLRALLEEYYRQTDAPARLIIPTGAYSVLLAPNEPVSLVPPDSNAARTDSPRWSGNNRGLLVTAVLVLTLVLVFLWQRAASPAPVPAGTFTIVVTGNSATETSATGDVATIAQRQLNGLLINFDLVAMHTGLQDLTPEQSAAAYRLDVNASPRTGGAPELVLTLLHIDNDEPIWSRRGAWTSDDDRNDLFLQSVASEVASDYGLLIRHHMLAAKEKYRPGLNCLAQSSEFRRSRAEKMIAPLEKCLAASIQAYPERPALYRDALSFLLYAKAEVDPTAIAARAEAKRLADEGFALAGLDSATANFAMARSYFFERNCSASARQLRAALDKNPADGERLAYGGTYMFMCGKLEGKAMLDRAVALDGDRASVALATLAYLKLRQKDGQGALRLIDRVVPSLRQEPQIELARASALHDLGRHGEAIAIMVKLRRRAGADSKTPAETLLRQFISNPVTINVLAGELRSRGLQP